MPLLPSCRLQVCGANWPDWLQTVDVGRRAAGPGLASRCPPWCRWRAGGGVLCAGGDDAALLCGGDAVGSGGEGGARRETTGSQAQQPESHSFSDGEGSEALGNILRPRLASHIDRTVNSNKTEFQTFDVLLSLESTVHWTTELYWVMKLGTGVPRGHSPIICLSSWAWRRTLLHISANPHTGSDSLASFKAVVVYYLKNWNLVFTNLQDFISGLKFRSYAQKHCDLCTWMHHYTHNLTNTSRITYSLWCRPCFMNSLFERMTHSTTMLTWIMCWFSCFFFLN